MSGFAHVTGQPDGPPTLPPFFLADGVAAQSATCAVMMALYHRDVHGGGGPADRRQPDRAAGPAHRDVDAGLQPPGQWSRAASATGSPASAPRNAYRTADGRWVALSSASPNIALRVLPRHRTGPSWPTTPTTSTRCSARRTRDEIDALVAGWIAPRTLAEVMDTFEQAEVAAAPVYDAEQLLADEHLQAAGLLRPGGRPRPRDHDGAGAGGALQRHARARRVSSAGASGPTTTRSTVSLLGLDAERLAALRAAGTI